MLNTLKTRFAAHPERHAGLEWETVEARLIANESALETLRRMEETGGEPDTIGFDEKNGRFVQLYMQKILTLTTTDSKISSW